MSPSHVAVDNGSDISIGSSPSNRVQYDNNYHFLVPNTNDTISYIDSLVERERDQHQHPSLEEEEHLQQEIHHEEGMLEDIELEQNSTINSNQTRLRYNLAFPFNQCSFDHLKDSSKSLKLGLTSSIDTYSSTFYKQQRDNFHNNDNDDDDDDCEDNDSSGYEESMIDYDADDDEESDYDEDYDEEVILPIHNLHISPNKDSQPLVSILKQQSSPIERMRRSSSITATGGASSSSQSNSSLELSIITSKINSIIEEYFPSLINDEDFIEIKNYVINYLIIFLTKTETSKIKETNTVTSDNNINSSILNLFIQKQFKLNLIEKIFEILIEKYESIKIDSFLDYFLDFTSKSNKRPTVGPGSDHDVDDYRSNFINDRLLHNPKFYDRYKIIWKLDHLNYKYYDKSYFIDDYFNNLNYNYRYSYHNHSNDEFELWLNKNNFSMNFDKFFIYYNRDIKAGRIYDDDGDYDDEGYEYDDNISTDENYDYYDYSMTSSSSTGLTNSNGNSNNAGTQHRSSTSSTSSSSSSTSANSMFSDRRVSEASVASSFSSKPVTTVKKSSTTSIPPITTTTNTIPKPKTVQKSLRFSDHIDVLSINRHEPVYYLNCIRI